MSKSPTRTPSPPSPSPAHLPPSLPLARILTILTLILILPIISTPVIAQDESKLSPDFDRWYLIEMQNQHAGWMHESQSTDPATGDITTAQEIRVNISRNQTLVEMRLAGRFVESKTHQPLSLWTLEKLGTTPHEITYLFNQAEISVKKNHAPAESIPPLETNFQTPAQARATLIKNLKSTLNQFQITTLDPLAGITPVTLHYTIRKRNTTAEVHHQNLAATQWSIRPDNQPDTEALELVDANARLLYGTSSFSSFKMTFILSDKQTAQSPGSAPELLTTTFIKPDRIIRNPRRARKATFELTVTAGTALDLPTTAAQTVHPQKNAPGTVRITIDLEKNHPATPTELENRADYLKSSSYINADSANVRALVTRALKKKRQELPPNEDPTIARQHAETLRAFTFRYIKKKDLGIGFASADEVAQTRNGDCTEHAVLLAALLRANGIPARIASGLLYAESFAGQRNIFSYHLWTQALINDEWIDLDPTLRRPFDATHLTIQTSALNNDSLANTLAATATLFGRLEIKIIAVEYQ